MLTGTEYAVAGIVAVGWLALLFLAITRPRGSVWRPRRFYRTPHPRSALDPSDAAQQLNSVMAASFERKRLLSRSEFEAFRVIEADLAAARRGYRVFAQTCLGEVLASDDDDAFRSINSKRVDILIVDPGGWPVIAVEYQGDRHWQGKAAARDAIKKEALRKAGVRYVEVSPGDSAEQIRSRVREHLGWEAMTDRRRRGCTASQTPWAEASAGSRRREGFAYRR